MLKPAALAVLLLFPAVAAASEAVPRGLAEFSVIASPLPAELSPLVIAAGLDPKHIYVITHSDPDYQTATFGQTSIMRDPDGPGLTLFTSRQMLSAAIGGRLMSQFELLHELGHGALAQHRGGQEPSQHSEAFADAFAALLLYRIHGDQALPVISAVSALRNIDAAIDPANLHATCGRALDAAMLEIKSGSPVDAFTTALRISGG